MIDPRALLLGVGCVLFGGIIVAELSAGDADSASDTTLAKPAGEAPAVAAGRPVRVDASLAEILARPLFNPNRRPPEAARQGEASVGELGGERLSGIVVEADRRLAIFAVAGTKPQTLGEGDTVAGWRIENIAPGEVSLSGPGGVQTLRPKSDPNAVRQVRPGPQVKSTEAVSRPDPRTLTAPARPVPAPQPAGTAPGTRPASPNRRRGE